MTETQGLLESLEWPQKLDAHVAQPGNAPRLHGYDVQHDLAAHYELTELSFLALTGELPSEGASRALRAALVFASPSFVHHAPAHAATLAHRCGAAPSAVIALAATALAEEVRFDLDAHAALFEWFETGSSGPLPPAMLAPNDEGKQATAALAATAGHGPWAACLADSTGAPLSPFAAVVSVLFHTGLKSRAQLETCLVLARLATASAEAFAAPVGRVRNYPQRLPDFQYEET
ncbi:MAG: hypothetical protein HY791_17320 [Deltaproteobacteria bacterium]|nr:hypothetical protein [Deltaproteobacteria bacterium]